MKERGCRHCIQFTQTQGAPSQEFLCPVAPGMWVGSLPLALRICEEWIGA